jgi:hypothetical protein
MHVCSKNVPSSSLAASGCDCHSHRRTCTLAICSWQGAGRAGSAADFGITGPCVHRGQVHMCQGALASCSIGNIGHRSADAERRWNSRQSDGHLLSRRLMASGSAGRKLAHLACSSSHTQSSLVRSTHTLTCAQHCSKLQQCASSGHIIRQCNPPPTVCAQL